MKKTYIVDVYEDYVGSGLVIKRKAYILDLLNNKFYFTRDYKTSKKIETHFNEEENYKIVDIIDGELFTAEIKKLFEEYELKEYEQVFKVLNLKEEDKETYFSFWKNYHNYLNINVISILNELNDFEKLRKSPYSSSFYNSSDIDWDYKPEGSLRLSDHWNFRTSRNDYQDCHCQLKETTAQIYNSWMLCKYKNGKYEVLKYFGGKPQTKEEEDFINSIKD